MRVVMDESRTLPHILQTWADQQPEAVAFVHLANGEIESRTLTYLQLHTRAIRIACALMRRNIAHADAVLLLLPQDLRFIEGIVGCLYARAVAVPTMVPSASRPWQALTSIVKSVAPRAILTTHDILERLQPRLSLLSQVSCILLEEIEQEDATASTRSVRPKDLALVQYSSGSTGDPKGIAITHANLIHNQECIKRAFGHSSRMIAGGWLPMYHDMGLIGLVLQPLYCGGRGVLMPPATFIQKPVRWLRMISDHGITTSGGPNFAFDLCAEGCDARDLVGVDLSRWSVAFNGAEPIQRSTIDRFCQTFASYGFRPAAMYPCYGLAESTLFVSGGDSGSGARFEAHPNETSPVRRAARENQLVSCGRAWLGTKISIVDPQTKQIRKPGEVGEVWISSKSVADGYFGNPRGTSEVFEACIAGTTAPEYLRTGDLGFVQGDDLVITGRIKDVIIIRGRNHYPQDIEATMAQSSAVFRKPGSAAFSVGNGHEEELILVQELIRGVSLTDYSELVGAIRQNVVDEHGINPHTVLIVTAGALPRTTSGKLRRSACRQLFLSGGFDEKRVAVTSAPTLVDN